MELEKEKVSAESNAVLLEVVCRCLDVALLFERLEDCLTKKAGLVEELNGATLGVELCAPC